MENFDFDARSFYKNHVAEQEAAFTSQTGLPVRYKFQSWDEHIKNDSASDEAFFVKTVSEKECYGVECGGMITYLLPISSTDSILLLFDNSFGEILSEIAQLSEEQFDVFSKYIPSIMSGLYNSASSNYDDYCLFVDEEMACVATRVNFSPLRSKNILQDFEESVLTEAIDLLGYRLQCSEEVASFEGYSPSDLRKITIKEGLSLMKYGAKFLRECCLQSIIN